VEGLTVKALSSNPSTAKKKKKKAAGKKINFLGKALNSYLCCGTEKQTTR
jgi:hypothetical protein